MAKSCYFTVRGVGSFPLDMLRYDRCSPVTSEDVVNMAASLQAQSNVPYEIHLISSTFQPTKERWALFGYKVVEVVKR